MDSKWFEELFIDEAKVALDAHDGCDCEPGSGGSGGTVTFDELDAEKVIFSSDLITTTPIGNITLENGQATIPAVNKNLKQVFEAIFVKESNPSITQPSVSLTFSEAKAYEVGTFITPTYRATLEPGTYSFGPDTDIVATSWEVTDTVGNSSNDASGSFVKFQVIDNTSYKITAKATYDAGAIPVTNIGNEYTDGRIVAGSKSATSGAVTGYRNTFYGIVTNKDDITSDVIRGLSGKSNKALTNGSTFTVTIPVGTMMAVIAYPATLRDITSIKDVNASNFEIASGFNKSIISVEGADGYTAIDYKVYTLPYAEPVTVANTFTVKI